MDIHERFMSKISVVDSGCWEWLGGRTTCGYGAFALTHKRQVSAHRYAYIYFVGPIPEGKQIDHLCRNRPCCNPEHLEAVTVRENLLRGHGFNAVNAAKERCPQGHQYSGANLYIDTRGCRVCRTCKREHGRRYSKAAR